jgi:hypothetical protein
MVNVTITWGHLNPPKLSAWDAAAAHYEQTTGKVFAQLDRQSQIDSVRRYMSR